MESSCSVENSEDSGRASGTASAAKWVMENLLWKQRCAKYVEKTTTVVYTGRECLNDPLL